MSKNKTPKQKQEKQIPIKEDLEEFGVGKKRYNIKKEYLLELKLNHAEMRELTALKQANEMEMRALDSQRSLTTVKKNEIRLRETALTRKNKDFLDMVSEETGIDLREKALDLDNYEVTDLD